MPSAQRKITVTPPAPEPMNTAAFVAPEPPSAPVAPPAASVHPVAAVPEPPSAPIAAPEPAATSVPTPPQQDTTNVTKIKFDNIDEPPNDNQNQPAAPAKPKVEDLLKDVSKDELYKFLGLDEHDIKFSDFRKKGGNPYDYIKQKSIDYTKVSDEILLKDKLKEKYPSLDDKKINILYDDRYGKNDTDDDNTNERKGIIAEADAYEIRQERIKQQQSNEIPAIQQPQQQNDYAQQQQKQLTDYQNYVYNDTPVQTFLTEKKLKIDLGNGKFHTFEIENPKHLVDSMLDSKVAAKYGNNAQGKLDTQLMLEIALYRSHPQQFRLALLEQGKSMALLDELLKDGQNATPPAGKAPSQPASTNKKITPSGTRITQHG